MISKIKFEDLLLTTGAEPSPADTRDFMASSYRVRAQSVPAGDILYTERMRPVRYQGGLGACVAFGVWGAFEAFELDELATWGSPLDLYIKTKATDGYPEIEGTFPRAALDVLLKQGSCDEELYPYLDIWPPVTDPKIGAETDSLKHRIRNYARVMPDIDSIREALWQFGPLVFAMTLHDNFFDTNIDGFAPDPRASRVAGGHCMTLVGVIVVGGQYYLVFKNSWSTRWGKYGYCYFKAEYLSYIDHHECWSFVDGDAVVLHWQDLKGIEMSQDDLLAVDAVWQRQIMKGYEDGSFRPAPRDGQADDDPYGKVTVHQVGTIMERLKLVPENPWCHKTDWTTIPTRGFIHEQLPMLDFKEERWEEPLTRYQLLLLTGRAIRKNLASTRSKSQILRV